MAAAPRRGCCPPAAEQRGAPRPPRTLRPRRCSGLPRGSYLLLGLAAGLVHRVLVLLGGLARILLLLVVFRWLRGGGTEGRGGERPPGPSPTSPGPSPASPSAPQPLLRLPRPPEAAQPPGPTMARLLPKMSAEKGSARRAAWGSPVLRGAASGVTPLPARRRPWRSSASTW